MDMANLDNDLEINLNDLHNEWLHQPGRYMKYAELAAQAQRTRDQAKERIDVVWAECDNMIRENPADFNCPQDKSGSYKPTEAWIKSVIQRQSNFQKANDEYHAANYTANVLKSAVSAFDHRKKALENEVNLWQGGYFSVPIDRVEAADKQREGLTRRKRG